MCGLDWLVEDAVLTRLGGGGGGAVDLDDVDVLDESELRFSYEVVLERVC
jgi:hypothetical protein